MFFIFIKMKVLPRKRHELEQTLVALSERAGEDERCVSHHVFRDIKQENVYSLIEVWKRREDLKRYFRSNRFIVLVGSRTLLNLAPKIMVGEVSNPTAWETLDEVWE